MQYELDGTTPTPLAKAFADKSDAVVWTHEGFSINDERMTREIAKAVIKAHDAGAELNVVAQGRSAAPVLKALKAPGRVPAEMTRPLLPLQRLGVRPVLGAAGRFLVLD